jgi:mRNA-degrading endonuclease RelE of RelBE toxin-antitoxin system
MRKLDLTNDAMRFLKKRDNKQFMQILNGMTSLCSNPRPADSISLGNGKHSRKDEGEYRIIYCFDDNVVCVFVVANRNDDAAYKEFDNKR